MEKVRGILAFSVTSIPLSAKTKSFPPETFPNGFTSTFAPKENLSGMVEMSS
jgi:hypothetical protein